MTSDRDYRDRDIDPQEARRLDVERMVRNLGYEMWSAGYSFKITDKQGNSIMTAMRLMSLDEVEQWTIEEKQRRLDEQRRRSLAQQ
jgi:hypothetical protein